MGKKLKWGNRLLLAILGAFVGSIIGFGVSVAFDFLLVPKALRSMGMEGIEVGVLLLFLLPAAGAIGGGVGSATARVILGCCFGALAVASIWLLPVLTTEVYKSYFTIFPFLFVTAAISGAVGGAIGKGTSALST